MKKLVVACMLMAFTSTTMLNAHANGDNKQNVLKTALSYGNSVHCDGTAFHENKPLNSVFQIDEMRYAVLQHVDLNCSGGNGSDVVILTPVVASMAGRFVVDLDEYPDGNMFENVDINNRFIESASYDVSRKHLTLTHFEYDGNDSNHHASLKYRTTINLNNNKIVNKQFLGKQR